MYLSSIYVCVFLFYKIWIILFKIYSKSATYQHVLPAYATIISFLKCCQVIKLLPPKIRFLISILTPYSLFFLK